MGFLDKNIYKNTWYLVYIILFRNVKRLQICGGLSTAVYA